jgi:hypothetical protein
MNAEVIRVAVSVGLDVKRTRLSLLVVLTFAKIATLEKGAQHWSDQLRHGRMRRLRSFQTLPHRLVLSPHTQAQFLVSGFEATVGLKRPRKFR